MSCLQAGSTDTTFLRSGNPGYIVGEPLVAGTLTTLDDKYPFEHFLLNWDIKYICLNTSWMTYFAITDPLEIWAMKNAFAYWTCKL